MIFVVVILLLGCGKMYFFYYFKHCFFFILLLFKLKIRQSFIQQLDVYKIKICALSKLYFYPKPFCYDYILVCVVYYNVMVMDTYFNIILISVIKYNICHGINGFNL